MTNETMMEFPTKLARPLAGRVARLKPAPVGTPAEPDIPAGVIAAAAAALDRGETHYTDRPGIPELRGLVAGRLNARYGLKIEPAAVTITCGATEARFCAVQILATKALICPGDAAAYAPLAALMDLPLLRDGDGAPGEGCALVLSPDDAGIDAWLDAAVANGWAVIWDVTGRAMPEFHPAARPELATRTVTIDDLEASMPGWRIGWLAGSNQWSALRAAKQALTICSASVSQWAALAYLEAQGGDA